MTILRPGQRVWYLPGIGVTTSRRAVSAPAGASPFAEWFNYCWIFKGAASQAASYVDVVSGQTLTLGTAPTWTSAAGLDFLASGGTYLKTGLTPTNTWTAMIRMSGLSPEDQWVFGNYNASGWGIQPCTSIGTIYYNGSSVIVSASRTSGVWALAGTQGYYNGAADGSATSGTASFGDQCWLGDISGPYRRNMDGSVQAFALRTSTLDAAGVAAAYAAMAAL